MCESNSRHFQQGECVFLEFCENFRELALTPLAGVTLLYLKHAQEQQAVPPQHRAGGDGAADRHLP